MLIEQPAHGKLAGRGKLDQFAIAIEKDLAGMGPKLPAEQKALDAERFLGVRKGAPQRFHGDAVLGAKRTQHMRFDQVRERK